MMILPSRALWTVENGSDLALLENNHMLLQVASSTKVKFDQTVDSFCRLTLDSDLSFGNLVGTTVLKIWFGKMDDFMKNSSPRFFCRPF